MALVPLNPIQPPINALVTLLDSLPDSKESWSKRFWKSCRRQGYRVVTKVSMTRVEPFVKAFQKVKSPPSADKIELPFPPPKPYYYRRLKPCVGRAWRPVRGKMESWGSSAFPLSHAAQNSSFSVSPVLGTIFKMPTPPVAEGETSSKEKETLSSKSSRKNLPDSQSKVVGVGTIEQLISQIKDFDFDPDGVNDIFTPLQDFIEIYTSKSRDIKAGVRDSLNERVIAPLIKFIKDRETTHLANIYDLKAREVDVNIRQYQAKIREGESTIEYLRGKLNLLNTELFDFKKVLKDSSQGLLETTKEVQSIISKATPSFSQVLQSRPAVPVRVPVSQSQENHVVLLRPKKDSTSEDNRKLVENALVVRNSAARINRISKFDNFFGVKQCKHCRRFGHTTKWCPRAKDVLCDHCGDDHPSASCKEVSCINCKESNQRTGSNFDFKHKPFDRLNCESFQKQKANLVRLTDYGAP
ncbi:hypothetical protein AVEN_21780-1 [Araneus ventricosus]|uniref:CCHC-type domain-containing protein n=1 Tax=Araneus ventricosus TaxID=182803 RepID=A0A4Y2NPJ9_ARAVE|nr:hypothetical protein AVEN_21780-1 [Araneus ventricosus]